MSKQYTIRAVPSEMDEALRRRAEREGKSLNSLALEILAQGLELNSSDVEYNDLDSLIGTWQEDKSFDAAIAEFDGVDQELWK